MQRIKPWHWGACLIFLAISILIYQVWSGMKGQRAMIWKDARIDNIRWSKLIATELDSSLEPYKRGFKTYQYPPLSGDIQYNPDASDETLRKYQNEGGTTLAGLPVRVLAGLALLERYPAITDAEKLLEITCKKEPSTITPNVIETVIELMSEKSRPNHFLPWKQNWNRDEQARTIITEIDFSDVSNLPEWQVFEDEIWWFQLHSYQPLSYIHPSDLKQVISHMRDKYNLPYWTGIQLQIKNTSTILGESGIEQGKTLIGDLEVSVGVTDVSQLESNWKKTRNWNIMIMSLAVIVLSIGFGIVAHGDAKERKRQREQNNFIASVTHELRAPVGSMRLMAETLELGNMEASKVAKFHSLIAREGSRLSNLIENILDLSRIEAGKSAHHPRMVSLTKIALSATETLDMQAKEKNVSVQLPNDDIEVSVDPLLFKQALLNLIDNAIKFSPEGELVIIHWQHDSKKWQLSVTDNGPGIPAGEEKKIFNRFYRTGDEMKRETQGVGIGLNLVKQVISAHKGTINVKNNPGAHFTLTFPTSHSNKPNPS